MKSIIHQYCFLFLATFNLFVNARYSDISVDCNDFDAGFLITYRKINDIWTKNEINNNNNHKAS